MRSLTIRCSRRFLSLRRSCSPRWSSTAGSELRRVEPASATVDAPDAGAADQQLGAGAEEGRLGGALAEAEARGELLAQGAEDRRRFVGRAASTATSRARTTLLISPPAMRSVARRPPLRSPPAGARCESPAGRSGVDRATAAESGRRPAIRAAMLVGPAGSSPGGTTRLTVRNVSSPARQSETSGRIIEAGANEDHGDEPPPSAIEGEATGPDRPRARGQARRLPSTAPSLSRRHSPPTSSKRSRRASSPRGRPPGRPARIPGRVAPSRTSGQMRGLR